MRLLEDLRSHMRPPSTLLNGWACVYVQHLLASNRQCVEFLESVGLNRDAIRIFGKGYSTSRDVLNDYVRDGYAAIDRSSDYEFDGPFDEQIIAAVARALSELIKGGSERILVLDEGGIAIRALDRIPLDKVDRIAIAELTTRGTPYYRLVSGKWPVVDVARSNLKKEVEAVPIATSMLSCLEDQLRSLGLPNLRVHSIGIVGNGSIGGELRRQLAERGQNAQCFDLARERSDAESIGQLFERCSMVLSSTGGNVLRLDDLTQAKASCVFVNCGSSDVEFNLHEAMQLSLAGNEDLRLVFSRPPWSAPADLYVRDRKLAFLRGGFPINFDGSSDPIPVERIQLTRAAMMAGAIAAVSETRPGVHALDDGVQQALIGMNRTYRAGPGSAA
jgi:hypothetical protein